MNLLNYTLMLGLSAQALGHGGEDHSKDSKSEAKSRVRSVEIDSKQKPSSSVEKKIDQKKQDKFESAYAKINVTYQKTIRPIFRRACYDCHSIETKYPWYHKIPGVKGMIDADISEARSHLELGDSFPFGGHGNPKSDLKAIAESVVSGSMPPLKYKVMHWDAFLSDKELTAIEQWVLHSLESFHGSKVNNMRGN